MIEYAAATTLAARVATDTFIRILPMVKSPQTNLAKAAEGSAVMSPR
jgi:hypothetical protein